MKVALWPRRVLGRVAAAACALITTSAPAVLGQSPGADVPVPQYRVDPFWPKMPLPNKWLIQGVPVMVTDH